MCDRYQPGSLVGCFAFSKAGHDKGQIYVVTAQKDDLVWLCDGRLKRLDAPKKKKLKHIQPVRQTVEKELLDRMIRREPVRDEEIKYQIRLWLKAAKSISCEK